MTKKRSPYPWDALNNVGTIPDARSIILRDFIPLDLLSWPSIVIQRIYVKSAGAWTTGFVILALNCHPERSEGSAPRREILRSAQDDRVGWSLPTAVFNFQNSPAHLATSRSASALPYSLLVSVICSSCMICSKACSTSRSSRAASMVCERTC